MSARGRFLSVLVTIVMAMAGFVTVGALPSAASAPIVQYVALGDSYAAGTAAGSYPNDCQQTDESYPEFLILDSRIRLRVNAACSGAKTFNVAEIVNRPLPELNDETRLVTLTVGAADLGLSGVLNVCTDPARTQTECLIKIAEARALLQELGGDLTDLYAAVARAAPRARIVVTGYPHLFEPLPPNDPRAVVVAAINSATDALNSTMEQAVAAANDADVNIHYVDVTEEFAGHGIVIGSTEQDFIYAAGSEAFHPTAAGYQAYADAISVALPGGWLKQLV